MKHVICALICLCCSCLAMGQTCNPSALYVTYKGEELEDASTAVNAPLEAHFKANPENCEGFSSRFEWKIWKVETPDEIVLHRFEEDLDYKFESSGSYCVQLYATFVQNGDTISYPEDGQENPIRVVIKESKLEMPNAFSPNGDGNNDKYNAKSDYQSIVSFKATIFNRWGQRIYSWTNPERDYGWDGTWHGRKVRDGVYYVVVSAKGADGYNYNIRKDVNLLTTFDNGAKEGAAEE